MSATATSAPRSVGDIESFITMLRSACSDEAVYQRLEQLLVLPDQKRQAVVHAWVTDLLVAQAPNDFIQAVGCLVDDKVAEKAYEVIFQCNRENRASRPIALMTRKSIGVFALCVAVGVGAVAIYYVMNPSSKTDQRSRASPIMEYGATVKGKIQRLMDARYGSIPKRERTKSATVRLKISQDGALISAEVKSSSGDGALDELALDVVKASAPFGAMPDEMRKQMDILEVESRFYFK